MLIGIQTVIFSNKAIVEALKTGIALRIITQEAITELIVDPIEIEVALLLYACGIINIRDSQFADRRDAQFRSVCGHH